MDRINKLWALPYVVLLNLIFFRILSLTLFLRRL